MTFYYDEKKLSSNPHVSKIDGFSLILTIDFKIKLYKEWRQSHDPGAIQYCQLKVHYCSFKIHCCQYEFHNTLFSVKKKSLTFEPV